MYSQSARKGSCANPDKALHETWSYAVQLLLGRCAVRESKNGVVMQLTVQDWSLQARLFPDLWGWSPDWQLCWFSSVSEAASDQPVILQQQGFPEWSKWYRSNAAMPKRTRAQDCAAGLHLNNLQAQIPAIGVSFLALPACC